MEAKRHETRVLACKLTEEELLSRGQSLAAALQDIASEENRQVDMKAQMKARLSELDAKKTQLSITIVRKEEDRDVNVTVYHDYDRKLVEVVRDDSADTVSSRRMNDEELQRSIPGLR